MAGNFRRMLALSRDFEQKKTDIEGQDVRQNLCKQSAGTDQRADK